MSMRIGKIMGIPVRIHYTLWLVFALIAWSLAYGYMPHQYPGLSTGIYWAIGIASAIILFASVLIHELSHSYVAKKNGLPIARITLFFFGGVSEMTEEPQDPGLEVRMAIAGPAMSLAIAAVLGGLWYISKAISLPVPIIATLGYGALINAVLAAFNLLPAFPLDGGRVFRGSLWKHSNSLIGATRTATRFSEVISLLMMLGGFAAIIFGDFVDGIWIVVMGWFIRSGAETSLGQSLVGEALTGVTVNDIMTRNVLTVPPEMTVHQLVQDYFLIYHHDGYPVVKDGEIQGIVTLRCVRSVPKEQRASVTIAQAMVPRDRTIVIKPTQSALDAFQKMARARVGRLLVAEDGKLMGILTRGDVMRTIQTRRELGISTIRQPSLGPQSPTIPGQTRYCVQCGAQLLAGTQTCPYCRATQPQL
jgi:Zn-dependent protease/predicted transcriptional regulator